MIKHNGNTFLIEKNTRYGMLVTIEEREPFVQPSGQRNRAFLCQCDCGNTKIVRLAHLSNNRVLSCGCLGGERHDLAKTPIYRVWTGMKNRCYLKSSVNSSRYLERGIIMCDEWKNSFTAFNTWAVLNGWKHGLQIDRINNNGNYEPSNCRFVTNVINVNNREITKRITYNGLKQSLQELLRNKNLSENYGAIYGRIERGWNEQKAIDTPVKKGNYSKKKNRFIAEVIS